MHYLYLNVLPLPLSPSPHHEGITEPLLTFPRVPDQFLLLITRVLLADTLHGELDIFIIRVAVTLVQFPCPSFDLSHSQFGQFLHRAVPRGEISRQRPLRQPSRRA